MSREFPDHKKRPIDIEIPLIALSQHGGVRVLVEFANFAAAAGYSVRISIPKGRVGKKYDLHPNVEIFEADISFKSKYLTYFTYLAALPFILEGKSVIANFFVTFFPALLGNILFRKSFLYFVQDIESKYNGPLGKILNAFCEMSYRSSKIVAANSYLAKEIRSRGRSVLAQIDLGVSPSFLTQENCLEGRKFDLIVFPRHEPWKGLDRLIRILDLYRQRYGVINVLAVGQNPDSLVRLEMMGFVCERPVDERALVRAFDRARVTLFTSHREGFGLPPLEGMARGLPAVVFECGGPSAYMRDGSNGYVIDGDDESSAVDWIHRLLTDDALYRSASDNARMTAAHHTNQGAFRALLALAVEQSGLVDRHQAPQIDR